MSGIREMRCNMLELKSWKSWTTKSMTLGHEAFQWAYNFPGMLQNKVLRQTRAYTAMIKGLGAHHKRSLMLNGLGDPFQPSKERLHAKKLWFEQLKASLTNIIYITHRHKCVTLLKQHLWSTEARHLFWWSWDGLCISVQFAPSANAGGFISGRRLHSKSLSTSWLWPRTGHWRDFLLHDTFEIISMLKTCASLPGWPSMFASCL